MLPLPELWHGKRVDRPGDGHKLERIRENRRELHDGPGVPVGVPLRRGRPERRRRDPAAGADTWSVVRPRFEDEPYLAGVSCPSSSRCVAVGDLWALSSTKPGAGKSAWKATRVKVPFPHPRLASLSAVSCPSVHLCVALPESHQRWIASSTNPFAHSPKWKIAHLGFAPQESAISCPSVSLCAFGDYTGRIVTSTDPTGGGAAWEIADRDPRTTIDDLSCPDPTLCVAVDSNANAIVGTG